MSDKMTEKAARCLVHQCGDAFGSPACKCVQKNIAAALREAQAEAFEEAAKMLLKPWDSNLSQVTQKSDALFRRAAAIRAGEGA